MVQTEMAAEAIKKVFPSIEIEIAGFETKGDLHLDKSLSAFGSKGAFTKELEGAMLDGRIDLDVNRYSKVCFFRLARTIYHTAHYCHFDI